MDLHKLGQVEVCHHLSLNTDYKLKNHILDHLFLSLITGYLFEGHLTVDPEPPQPQWLVQENLMSGYAAASMSLADSSPDNNVDARTLISAIAAASRSSAGASQANTSGEDARNLIEELQDRLDDIVSMVWFLSSILGVCLICNTLLFPSSLQD